MGLHVRGLFFICLFDAALLTTIINLLGSTESATVLKNETDHLALLAFKDGISGDPNRALSSWNYSLHFCKWGGVTCSKRHPQRVAVLNLTRQGLVGTLSPYIANLTFLRIINISFNNFQGHIPHEVGHLFRLQYLNLHSNSFNGEIPSNLTHCSELRFLNFGHNKLVGCIPLELSTLPKLDRLVLQANNLSGHLPPSLRNLSSLTILALSRNSLEGSIPESLARMEKLQVFAIDLNKLSGTIPSSLYNLSSIIVLSVSDNNNLHGSLLPGLGVSLPNLRWFSVGNNRLTGSIPNSLGNASSIRFVSLYGNNFIGTMPVNLGRLQALERLNVMLNQLSGDLSFIDSLTNCSKLERLSLSTNKFSGMLPNSIANLSSQLTHLLLAKNQIFGNIPIGIDNLANLIALAMGDNLLTGTIPFQLGNLHRLQGVALPRNSLSGKIPESLGNLSQLTVLSLAGNDMGGGIPQSLGSCQRLGRLFLSSNDLDGTIPEQIFNIPTLVRLDVDMNSLIGSLPSEVGKLNNILRLDVSNNKLSGEIPYSLGSALSLNSLYMAGNLFQGTIPSSLSSLKDIQELDLSRNNLSGQIPKYLEELPLLQYLNLSFNNLEGEVPKHGIFQNSTAFSILQNEKLCGGIPILKLASCPKQDFNKQRKVFPLKLTISIVVASLFVFLLSIFLVVRRCSKRPSKQSALSSIKNRFLEVTYADILKATIGFSLANLIGEGSYGSVYKGIIEHIETTVAIKVLKLQHQRASKSFIAECKALRSIQHRNIVKVLTVCSSIDFSGNDFKAFVFEFMQNGNLDMWLHSNVNEQNQLRALTFIQRLNIAIDVACALDYLHNHCETPVVHCDLKPSNILLDEDMVAHVSDFGLASILSEDLVKSSSLLMKGSIGYLAPEYGMGGEASTYGDIYSFGIFLLEMFTGKRPTDDMFKDNLSIHQFAKMALPRQVLDIIDHQLLSEEVETSRDNGDNRTRCKMHECLLALVSTGVSCSSELPKERMEMRDVVRELHGVRELYLGIKKYLTFPLLAEGPSYLSNY